MDNTIERPTINITGKLTDESAIELIDRIRVLRDQFFFNEVKLCIASPGGQLTALKFFVECVQELQGDGLKIATHALTTAASAAAVILSLGDVRTAHRQSLLLYHTGRLAGVHTITAKGAESIATALNSADNDIVSLLVDRAARARPPDADTPAELFALGDWTVVDRLSPGNARKPKTTLRRFRKRVADAFQDPSTRLTKLYSDFCALDAAVSPYLALELGLIDAVGDHDPTSQDRSAVADDGGLVVPEWESLYSGGRVPRAALTRHTLILGETGSGKTASGILPVLSAITGEASPVSTALVIDPKSEIYPLLRRYAGPDCTVRLLRAGVDSINVVGKSSAVAEAVSKGKWVTAAQKILACAASISDSPARVFAGTRASSSVNSYWENEGSRLARCVLAFTLLMSTGGRLEELVSNDLYLCETKRRHLTDFGEFAGLLGKGTEDTPMNVLAVAHRALCDFFLTSKVSSLTAEEVIDALRLAGMTDGEHDLVRRDLGYWDRISGARNQYAGVLGEARCCFADFADPAASKSLFFGLERRQATVDFAPDVEVDIASKGRVIYVYQPTLGHDAEALIAKALKGAFFKAVLASPARRERGGKMPLCMYVADEFHRFITSDISHGEQSFLDTCRSFGTACVLATQSEANIRHALALAREPSPDTAIQILLTNTATKLVFRSTEESVRKLVDGLSPGDGPHRLTAIRPPTTLRPGECYASLADGRFERRQLMQYNPPKKKVIEHTATCR